MKSTHTTHRQTLSLLVFLAVLSTALSARPVLAQQILEPDELCSNNPQAIASFADAVLEEAVREALSIGTQDALTCSLVTGLTALDASGPGGPVMAGSGSPEWPDPDHVFDDLAGMQNLTGLTQLTLNNRGITDISPLKGLTNLAVLFLHTNWISDLSALSGMTKLTTLFVSENPLGDISPLAGLTELTVLRLHRHGDNIGGQSPVNYRGATGLLFTNSITDISPLAGLTKLTDLAVHNHEVSDLSPLRGLTNLIQLRIAGNLFTDLSPLRGLTTLQNLELTGNSITDLSALSGLTNLRRLDLRYNHDLRNIQPLLENPGIGEGDIVELRLTKVTCADQALLAAKGVEVRTELFSACG